MAQKPAVPLVTTQPSTQPADGVVPWDKAGDYLDKKITIEGVVIKTGSSTKIGFLDFTKTRGAFYIAIFEPALSSFDAPIAQKFTNKKIRVTGTVEKYKDRLQIQVKATAQIVIVPDEK